MHIRLLLAATTFAVAVAGPAAAQTDVTGVWKAEFVTPDRVYPARLELKQDGDKLTGRIGSETQSNTLTGSANGADITFAFSTRDPNGADRMLAIDVKASMKDDKLTGVFNVDGGDGGTFSASKASKDAKDAKDSKEPAKATVDVTGAWAFSIDLGSISASPTVTFKQDGETLTGTYTSQQYGQFPLKGTIKGNHIEFGFTMAIEGNAIEVAYSGTADKDSMKGTASYAGLADGTFIAKKSK